MVQTCWVVALGTLVAGILGGCSSTATISIQAALGTPESTELQLQVDSCNQNPKVSVEESESEVRLKVTGDPDTGDDCADSVVAHLKAPLGDRSVIDESTDDEVEVSPPVE